MKTIVMTAELQNTLPSALSYAAVVLDERIKDCGTSEASQSFARDLGRAALAVRQLREITGMISSATCQGRPVAIVREAADTPDETLEVAA